MTLRSVRLDASPTGVVLRKEDEKECLDLGLSADEAIAVSFEKADLSYVVLNERDEPVAYWGHRGSPLGITGFIWMLSTPRVEDCPIAFGLASLSMLDEMLQLYHFLIVSVSSEYKKSKRWLKWLGFKKLDQVGSVDIMEIERD